MYIMLFLCSVSVHDLHKDNRVQLMCDKLCVGCDNHHHQWDQSTTTRNLTDVTYADNAKQGENINSTSALVRCNLIRDMVSPN